MRLILDLDSATVRDFIEIKNVSETQIMLITGNEKLIVPTNLIKILDSKKINMLVFKSKLEKISFVESCACNGEYVVTSDNSIINHMVGRKGRYYVNSSVRQVNEQKEKFVQELSYEEQGLSRLEIFKRKMKCEIITETI